MRIRVLAVLLGLAAAVVGAAFAVAQSRDLTVEGMRSEKRVALVIGNAGYAVGRLNNPVLDARAMAQALRGLGFEVLAHENLGYQGMRRAVADFGDRIAGGGVGLFYYSGHGLQMNGRNYLVPVDADLKSERYVSAETVDLDSVLAQMQEAKTRVNVVILDACRNNPFTQRFRSLMRGLAFVDAPAGTYVAYATAPGSVAEDGEPGKNGIYTGELLRALREPGLRIEDVFKRVRAAVLARTGHRQNPWDASSLTGEFFFSLRTAAVTPAPAPALTPEVVREYGSITIRGKFPGIEVWLNERKIGETELGAALVMNRVPAGTYRLKGRKAGYRDWEREIQVTANQPTELLIDIEPLRPEPAPTITETRTYRWNLQTSWPQSMLFHEAALQFASALDDLTRSRMKVEVLPAGAVVPAFEVLDAVSRRILDMTHTSSSYWIGKSRSAALFAGLPFGPTAEQLTEWLSRGEGAQLKRDLYATWGVVPFPAGATDTDMTWWVRKRITGPGDVKGLRLRSVGLQAEILSRVGVRVVVLPGGELVPALERGVIDGASWLDPSFDLQLGLHKVARYYYDRSGWPYTARSFELLVNKSLYDGLPPFFQEAIREAALRTNRWLLAEARSRSARALSELTTQHGVQVLSLPETVRVELRRATREYLESEAQKDAQFRRVYESLQRLERASR